MNPIPSSAFRAAPAMLPAVFTAALLAACGGTSDPVPVAVPLPQLAAATGAPLAACADIASKLGYANTSITSASSVAAGALTATGVVTPFPEHCLVTGKMNQRVSAVDGNSYAIGFEMRLPKDWNGRFFYQANGGVDGNVLPALGPSDGTGGGLTNALLQGFAVISSDAGHSAALGSNFGIDPQARLDYGYNAVAQLTPMAKKLIATAYGKGPDRSYFGGCSNGGRHTLVATSRFADQYDGFLAGAPGYNLPKAAIANIFGAQRYASVATNPADLSTAFTQAERTLVSNAVLAKCDALDGVSDGLVQDTTACQAAFSFTRDVPTCTGARDGSCLSAAQKTAIAPIFSGAVTSKGAPVYASFPFDAGLGGSGVPFWEFFAPLVLDSGSVGLIFQTPPEKVDGFNGPAFSLGGSIDDMVAKISATNATYTESGLSFMTPPNPSDLSRLKGRGAKVMVYHGVSDTIFSPDDTATWMDNLNKANGGDATNFARFYRVPGMNHCSGGPATDQFDMLTPLVNWVEKGVAPDSVVAQVRGTGSAAPNVDLPASWSAKRSRPLCVYPKVARYKGSGDVESAANFSCQ